MTTKSKPIEQEHEPKLSEGEEGNATTSMEYENSIPYLRQQIAARPDEATDKQLEFLISLAKERNTSVELFCDEYGVKLFNLTKAAVTAMIKNIAKQRETARLGRKSTRRRR